MRFRKNINCLTKEELQDFRDALAGILGLPTTDPDSFWQLACFHGGPPVAYCRHSPPGFFTWHRSYLMAYERALQRFNCEVSLPYWDWSSGPSTGLPKACSTATYTDRQGNNVPNPLYSGPSRNGGPTHRSPTIDTTPFDAMASQAQADMATTSFGSFQDEINGVHGWVHGTVGGDMGSVPTAAFDPVFFLHHSNVDRIWANWQNQNPGQLPASEATFPLTPFTRPTGVMQEGSDVESTDILGYRYLNFCFRIPPIWVWETALIPLPPEFRTRVRFAAVRVTLGTMPHDPMEVLAFVRDPDTNVKIGSIESPAFAGGAGVMGHGMSSEGSDCAECKLIATLPKDLKAEDKTGKCPHCGKTGSLRSHQLARWSARGPSAMAGMPEAAPSGLFALEINVKDSLMKLHESSNAFRLDVAALGFNGKRVPDHALPICEIQFLID